VPLVEPEILVGESLYVALQGFREGDTSLAEREGAKGEYEKGKDLGGGRSHPLIKGKSLAR